MSRVMNETLGNGCVVPRVLGLVGSVFGLLSGLTFAALNQQTGGAPQMPMLQPTEDIRDILPLVEVPFWTPGMIAAAVAGGLVVVILLVWAGVAWLNRVRPSLPSPSPRGVALKALEALKGPDGMALESRDFAAAVAEILREYLQAIHGIQATKQTTEEFLNSIESSSLFAQGERDQLRRFLAHCDRFKFAAAAADEEARKDLIGVVEEQVKGVAA